MGNTGTTFGSLLGAVTQLLCGAIPVLFVLATVIFLFGVVKYLTASGDEEKLSQSKTFMIYGLIGLFVMLTMWALVSAAVNTFFGGNSSGGNAC